MMLFFYLNANESYKHWITNLKACYPIIGFVLFFFCLSKALWKGQTQMKHWTWHVVSIGIMASELNSTYPESPGPSSSLAKCALAGWCPWPAGQRPPLPERGPTWRAPGPRSEGCWPPGAGPPIGAAGRSVRLLGWPSPLRTKPKANNRKSYQCFGSQNQNIGSVKGWRRRVILPLHQIHWTWHWICTWSHSLI